MMERACVDITESPEVFDGITTVCEQALRDATLVVGQKKPISVNMHTIERVHEDLTKSLEVFDGTTIVHKQALSDATLVVGQNRPEDVCMHAIERARDDVTESPDVMNYHTGVLKARDWTSVVLNLKSDNLIGQNLLVLAW